jgi:hypothetical protein
MPDHPGVGLKNQKERCINNQYNKCLSENRRYLKSIYLKVISEHIGDEKRKEDGT